MATVVRGSFEWDDAKAAANLTKHGVSFEEAATVFADDSALFLEDLVHEERFNVIGLSQAADVLFVVCIERGERDRIVSARPATAREERLYANPNE
ncbi:MAG TPA: BrnT family toxin [Polyangiaceae bacterium]